MSRLVPSLLILLLLVGIVGASMSPTSEAQDQTPVPTMVVTPSDDLMVMGLPFADTFDTDANWTPSGAWAYDTETAYEGGGWYLDGAERSTISSLTYSLYLNLSGALTAQLMFRQHGDLPISDLIAVDVTLDGGEKWVMVDQQIGLEEDEWEQHIVDLTNYRGQVVQLRFRVLAGMQLVEDEPVTGGLWIDNVSIQYVALPPEMVMTEDVTFAGPRTLMGLHLTMGANHDAVVELAKRLQAVGRPLGTLKGVTGTESTLNEVARISPSTVIVYRSIMTPEGQLDCPNSWADPTAEALRWVMGLEPYWSGVNADYYELMNECLPPMDWLVQFSIEAMRLATMRGQCLLLFSFPTGNPEPGQFAQLLPVFEYILQNPCQPGRYHGIALHAYGLNQGVLVSESGISLGYRHRLLMTPILQALPEAIQIPMLITEAGAGDGRMDFACPDVTRDVMQYTSQLEFDPYVRGFHVWTLGPANDANWTDISACLPMIGDALINYYAGR